MRTASRLLAVPLTLLALQLSACTEDAGGEPSEEPSQEAEETLTPTEEPTPEVPMATGPEVDRPAYSFNLPDGWTVDEGGITFSENDVVATGPSSLEGGRSLRFGATEVHPYENVEEGADDFLESVREQGSDKVRRVDDTEIDGETALHATGPVSRDTERFHAVLVLHEGLLVRMVVRTTGKPAQSLELVESIFATWEWK